LCIEGPALLRDPHQLSIDLAPIDLPPFGRRNLVAQHRAPAFCSHFPCASEPFYHARFRLHLLGSRRRSVTSIGFLDRASRSVLHAQRSESSTMIEATSYLVRSCGPKSRQALFRESTSAAAAISSGPRTLRPGSPRSARRCVGDLRRPCSRP